VLRYVKTYDFQVGSFLLDDVLVNFPLKNSYLYGTLANLSGFLLVISLIIFVINNRSFFLYLISVEIMLLASIINFLSYLYFLDWIESEIYIYYILTVAVAESAFGLGLLIHSFNLKKSINPLIFNDLN
jgi:NADH:ubiquinone oxidoreductase subunit K